MGNRYAADSLNYMKKKMLIAYRSGCNEIVFKVSDIRSDMGWNDGQSSISGSILEMCGRFKEAGEGYSYYPVKFPELISEITNLHGLNLTVRFRFPLDGNLEQVINTCKRGARKSVEKEFIAERIRREYGENRN